MKTLAFVGQKNVYMLAKTLHATTVKERLNKAYKATKLFSRCLKNKVVGFYKNKGYPKIKLVLPCKNRVFARKRLTKLVQSLYLQKQSFCTRSFVSFVSFVWLAKRSFARSFAAFGEEFCRLRRGVLRSKALLCYPLVCKALHKVLHSKPSYRKLLYNFCDTISIYFCKSVPSRTSSGCITRLIELLASVGVENKKHFKYSFYLY